MPRPPAELKRLEEERRRRDRAHRRLRWGRRLRVTGWLAGGLALAVTLWSLARLAGLSVG